MREEELPKRGAKRVRVLEDGPQVETTEVYRGKTVKERGLAEEKQEPKPPHVHS